MVRLHPHLDQCCGAIVADERAFIRDKTELDIEADRKILIGQSLDYSVAAQASMLMLRHIGARDFASQRDIAGHLPDPSEFGQQLPRRYIYLYISCATRRRLKRIPPGAAKWLMTNGS
jgi:hypothetical protein